MEFACFSLAGSLAIHFFVFFIICVPDIPSWVAVVGAVADTATVISVNVSIIVSKTAHTYIAASEIRVVVVCFLYFSPLIALEFLAKKQAATEWQQQQHIT